MGVRIDPPGPHCSGNAQFLVPNTALFSTVHSAFTVPSIPSAALKTMIMMIMINHFEYQQNKDL